MKETSDKSYLREIPLLKYMTGSLKLAKSSKTKRNSDSKEESEKTRCLNVAWYSNWNPGTEKRY
jgi:hypothetical protein